VASLYVPYSMFNAVGESWTYFFGLSIGLEVLLLAFVLRPARCVEPDCHARTWTESHPTLPSRQVMTHRAGFEAARQVGELARPVAWVADEFGVCWDTVMAAVTADGIQALGRTLRRRRSEILAHRDAGASSGTTEGVSLVTKNVKRAGHGLRRFGHYRLRCLLHTGGVTLPTRPSPPPIRSRRSPLG